MFLKIRREYIAPNTVASVIIGKEAVFQSIIDDMMNSSPSKLGVGGKPSLDTQVIIHQIVSNGVISLNPRVIDRVRVLFRSYRRLARQNIAEEISPCAIIKARAPPIPQFERENMPDATILICPTDE